MRPVQHEVGVARSGQRQGYADPRLELAGLNEGGDAGAMLGRDLHEEERAPTRCCSGCAVSGCDTAETSLPPRRKTLKERRGPSPARPGCRRRAQ